MRQIDLEMRPSVPRKTIILYPRKYASLPMMTICLKGKQSGQPGGHSYTNGFISLSEGDTIWAVRRPQLSKGFIKLSGREASRLQIVQVLYIIK